MKSRDELEDMTKQELVEEYLELCEDCENLQSQCDSWRDEYDELENEHEEVKKRIKDEIITDVDNFKRELERAGLMTNELKNFIEDYLRWDNNWKEEN